MKPKSSTLLVVLLALLLHVVGMGQQANATENTLSAALAKANTAAEATYLTNDERAVINYINLARLDGKLFCDSILAQPLILAQFVKDNQIERLRQVLAQQQGLNPLQPHVLLRRVAARHAMELAELGTTGSQSESGLAYYERIHQVMPYATMMGEAYQAGYDHPLFAAVALLINDASLPYDKRNLLSPIMNTVGIAMTPHSKVCHQVILDLANVGQVGFQPTVASFKKIHKPFEGMYKCPKYRGRPTPVKKSSWWRFWD